jgi:peptidoglycan/LPS O-acetylase OafA/YrhL
LIPGAAAPTSTAHVRASKQEELPHRLPGIDVLRALAASAVVVFHVVLWPWAYAGDPGWIGKVWRSIGQIGPWGVGIFFVLSGTCIHLPVARRLARGLAPAIDNASYFRRRFRRIYPPHLLVIFLSWATAAVVVTMPPWYQSADHYVSVPTPGQLLAHLFMLHTFVPGARFSICNVLWTIALEAHFYLLYPLLLRVRRRYRMETICAGLFAVMVALRLLDKVLPPSLAGVMTGNFLGRWWEWVLGAVIAERLVRTRQGQTSRSLAIGLTLASAVVACAVAKLPHGILMLYVCCPFLYGAVVFVMARMRPPSRWGLDGCLGWVGVRSYSLYLTHPISLTLVAWLTASGWPAWSTVALALATVYSVGWIYFVTVESRFLGPARPHEVAGERPEAVGSLAGTRSLGTKERETWPK